MEKTPNHHIALFKGKTIRKILYQKEWWFSVVDVVEALTDSPNPRQYWGKVKQREFTDLQLSPIWVQLKLESSDGKKYETDCANTEGMFRIIQSIPSPKAEPFKRWLAQVGYERVKEIGLEFLRKIKYSGVGALELKRDSRDNEFKFTERANKNDRRPRSLRRGMAFLLLRVKFNFIRLKPREQINIFICSKVSW